MEPFSAVNPTLLPFKFLGVYNDKTPTDQIAQRYNKVAVDKKFFDEYRKSPSSPEFEHLNFSFGSIIETLPPFLDLNFPYVDAGQPDVVIFSCIMVAVPKSNQAKVKFLLTIDGQQVEKKVEDVVRDQLYYFKGIVNRDYGEKVSFVFSRPQYWSPTQTEMFGTLLEEVFGTDKIVAVVTEPNAAQFCYKVCGAVENKHMVCVFDIGCGTFDISFLRETSPGTYAGIATGGNSFLGGADMDNQLLSALEEELSVVDGFKKDVFEEQKPLLLGHMKALFYSRSLANLKI